MLAVRSSQFLPRLLLLLLGCGLIGLLAAPPAQAQETRPRSERAPVQAIDAVATHALSALDNAALEARYPAGPGPLRFAEGRTTSIRTHDSGTWEALDDGTMLWRLRVRSENAHSINLGFTGYHMPPGGELFLYAPDYESVVGPFTNADNAPHGELWTPVIPGEEVIVEVTVPSDQQSALQLELGHVNHGFRAIRPSARKSSGSCNVDVACEEADGWRDQVRAVGTYTVSPEGGGTTICTGVLVNNTAGDLTPYFLTANHCGVDESNASSMVIYWNYENPTCRSPGEDGGRGDGTLNDFTSGAIYRAGYGFGPYQPIEGRPDFTLVELDEPIDPQYNVRFAGWNRGNDPPSASVAIHHPHGQEKRISFDFDPATITSYTESTVTDEPTHLRVGNWEVGTTEVGSSGSPLFDPDARVVGVLSGGFAGCTSDPAEDNNEPDWYGRFAVAWEGGGTRDTRLRDWLDPTGTEQTAVDGTDMEDDQTPPAAITDFTIEAVDRDGITLQWTATGDDGFEGTATQYELRYSTAPIRDQAAFDSARVVADVPAPQPSGSTERFTVRGLDEDTPYYFALIARDNLNNASPIAHTAINAVIVEDRFTLQAGYPNPFRTTTTVGFAVQEPQRVRVDLYDALGRHVQHLYDDTPLANSLQRLRIDGGALASGVYFVRFTGQHFRSSTQVVRTR